MIASGVALLDVCGVRRRAVSLGDLSHVSDIACTEGSLSKAVKTSRSMIVMLQRDET